MSGQIKISLDMIKKHNPYVETWKKLLESKNKTKSDNVMFPFSDILKYNGLYAALWCLRVIEKDNKELLARFNIYCAKRCEPKMKDERSINALRACENGTVTDDILYKADSAASTTAPVLEYASPACRHAVDAACAAARAAYYAAAFASNFKGFYAAYPAIEAADNKEAEKKAIERKLKQILDTGEFKED